MASKTAIVRLKKEMAKFHKEPPPFISVAVNERNMLIWHYLIEGPSDSPYAGGWYWGRLRFPPEYPFKPPGIQMHTPNGRFRTNTALCLSMSDFHPETWNPMWSLSTVLTGLLSFMLEAEPTSGSIQTSDTEKKAFAADSAAYNLRNAEFRGLFPEFEALVERRKQEVAQQASGGAAAAEPTEAAERRKQRGNELFKEGKYVEADAEYSAAILLCAKQSTFFGNRAACRVMLRRWDAALADCEKALELDPSASKFHLRAAKCLTALGRCDEATASLSKVGDLPGVEEERRALEAARAGLRLLEEIQRSGQGVPEDRATLDKWTSTLLNGAVAAGGCVELQRWAARCTHRAGRAEDALKLLREAASLSSLDSNPTLRKELQDEIASMSRR